MGKYDDIPKNIGELIAAHTQLYLTDPAAAHMWDARPVGLPGPVPTLLLTTRGRASGELRHVPLLYFVHEQRYLIVGSRGGSPGHPAWFLNLAANPDCVFRVGESRAKARARVLDGVERETAWRAVTVQYPVYLKYQARTERQIPLVVLEPVTD